MKRTTDTLSLLSPRVPGAILLYRLLIVLFVALTGAAAHAAAPPSSSAALVNGTVISAESFQHELERIRRQQGTGAKLGDAGVMARLKREALENLITRELLMQESRRRKVKVDEKDVEREFSQLKGRFADGKSFSETLAGLKLSETMLRDQISGGIAIRNLVNEEIGSRITVSDEEIARYYEKNRERFTQPAKVLISHILVRRNPDWDVEKKRDAGDRIAALRVRIDKGEDFSNVARRYSEDNQTSGQGGILGWFVAGQLSGELEKAVNSLKIGQVSPVVEDRFGLHIVKLLERTAAFTPTLDELKVRIRALVKQEKGSKLLKPYVAKLRDAAKVEILLADGK